MSSRVVGGRAKGGPNRISDLLEGCGLLRVGGRGDEEGGDKIHTEERGGACVA